jgi:hypothetical protein
MAIIERVPRLNIRPKHLIKVYSLNIEGPIPLIRSDTDLEKAKELIDELAKSDPIGTIQSITITSTRGVGFYRILNFDYLGKIYETYPHLSKYSASVTNVAFYKQHLLNAFKATKQGDVFTNANAESNNTSIVPTFNIYNQIAPLIIKVEMLEPSTDDKGNVSYTNGSTRSIILWDCWFDKSEIEFKVEEDVLTTQEADITFAWIFTQ